MQIHFIICHLKAGQNLNALIAKNVSLLFEEFQLETFNFYNEIQWQSRILL